MFLKGNKVINYQIGDIFEDKNIGYWIHSFITRDTWYSNDGTGDGETIDTVS